MKQPVILAGGVMLSQAWNETIELAELLGAPVATSINGNVTIPENTHSLLDQQGRQGLHGMADFSVRRSHVRLAVGCKFAQVATNNWIFVNEECTKTIPVHIDSTEIGRVYKTSVPMLTHGALLGALRSKSNLENKTSDWLNAVKRAKKE